MMTKAYRSSYRSRARNWGSVFCEVEMAEQRARDAAFIAAKRALYSGSKPANLAAIEKAKLVLGVK